MGQSKQRTANTGLAKVAVQCSADTFVVNQTLVLRINICGENRHLRQARNRYRLALKDTTSLKIQRPTFPYHITKIHHLPSTSQKGETPTTLLRRAWKILYSALLMLLIKLQTEKNIVRAKRLADILLFLQKITYKTRTISINTHII